MGGCVRKSRGGVRGGWCSRLGLSRRVEVAIWGDRDKGISGERLDGEIRGR